MNYTEAIRGHMRDIEAVLQEVDWQQSGNETLGDLSEQVLIRFLGREPSIGEVSRLEDRLRDILANDFGVSTSLL